MQPFHPLPQVLHSFPAKLWAETARTLTLKRTKEVKESNLPVSMRRRSEVLWFENFWARSHYVEPLYTILCCLRELRHHFKFILLQNRAVRVTPQASMIALFSLCLYNYQFLPTPSCLFLRFLEPLHFLKHRWWWWLFFFSPFWNPETVGKLFMQILHFSKHVPSTLQNHKQCNALWADFLLFNSYWCGHETLQGLDYRWEVSGCLQCPQRSNAS